MADPADASPHGSPSHEGGNGAAQPAHSERELWRALIGDGNLGERLTRLASAPELGLGGRCQARLRERAAFLEPERLLAAACARLCLQAEEFDGGQRLGSWIDSRIDLAIEDLCCEDEREERGESPLAPDDPRFARPARLLGVDTKTIRRGSVVFHKMPYELRAAFWAVILDGQSIEEHARRARIAPALAQERFERAMITYCTLGQQRDLPRQGPPARPGRRQA